MRKYKSIPAVAVFIILMMTNLSIYAAGSKERDSSSPEIYTASKSIQGIDTEKLKKLVDYIEDRKLAIDGFAVYHHGELVFEHYFGTDSESYLHEIYSCTKSFISTLIGIAITDGYISGVNQRVFEFFPEYGDCIPGRTREALTLEHLLTMSTGLKSEDSYLYRWKGLNGIYASDDWIRYVLCLEPEAEPGTRFDYSNLSSFLLSAIIQKTTGKSAEEYAKEKLFYPLGIEEWDWPENPQGITIGWAQLRLRMNDLAKLGLLYLNNGVWNGKQIIPRDWVEAATIPHMNAGTLREYYGYQWWIDDKGDFMALGYSGQYVIVSRKHNLVAVFNSNLLEPQFFVPYSLYNSYILAALE